MASIEHVEDSFDEENLNLIVKFYEKYIIDFIFSENFFYGQTGNYNPSLKMFRKKGLSGGILELSKETYRKWSKLVETGFDPNYDIKKCGECGRCLRDKTCEKIDSYYEHYDDLSNEVASSIDLGHILEVSSQEFTQEAYTNITTLYATFYKNYYRNILIKGSKTK